MHYESHENPFTLSGRYENRDGPYTVLEFVGNRMRIRYDNGEEKIVSIEIQAKILRNLIRDKNLPPTISHPTTSLQSSKPPKRALPPPIPDPVKAGFFKLDSDFNSEDSQRCSNCRCVLFRHPVIMIAKTPFCFRCSRAAYSKILNETRKLQERERRRTAPARKAYKEAWRQSQSAVAQYNSSRESAAQAGFFSDPNRILTAIWGSIVIGIIIPIVGLIAFLPILWILEPIWDRVQDKRKAEFDKTHSPPKPFNDKAPVEIFIPDPYVDLHPDCSDAAYIGIGYKRLAILNRDLHTCQICGNCFTESDLEVHHILPRAKGGSDSERNLTTLCKRCHFHEDWFDHVHKFNQQRIAEKNREEFRA